MNIIIALLAVIAAAEVLRLYLSYKPVTRKAHFKQKLAGVEKMGWDLEFKVFKTKEIREDVRRVHSDTKSKLASIEDMIKNWPPEKDKEELARLEDQKVLLQRDIERYENQMKNLDVEISGSKQTNEYPDGAEGINDQIDSLKELEGMLKDWIKNQ